MADRFQAVVHNSISISIGHGNLLARRLVYSPTKNFLERAIKLVHLIDLVKQFVVCVFRFNNADAQQITKLAADGIYLLIDLPCDLANIERTVRIAIEQL